MKIRLSRKLKQMASALLVVMVLGSILCLFVMYYLSLIQQQNTLSIRSQAWNIAIAISEAGIEEGLQALNSTGTPSSADGWQLLSDGRYWRTNTWADGNKYEVAINPAAKEIIARAYVGLPALAANTPSTLFAVAGGSSMAGPCIVSRAVRVRYARSGYFLAPLVAKHKIDLKGNGILTDSFDSSDPWRSNFGQYDPTLYAGDRGDIASNDGVVSSISVQNANIYGKAHTGPDGTVTVGSKGAVGTHAWQALGNTGFQDGYVLQDANFTFPETGLPYSSGLSLGDPATIVTVAYDYLRTPTNSTAYPEPLPWGGVLTNIVSYTTNRICPTPPPPGVFNTTLTRTEDWYPNPIPAGIVTNTVSWQTTWYPYQDYLEPVNKVGSWYFYQHITGYSWKVPAYAWPTYSYTWNLYTTNAVYTTNYYDHVIDSGKYYTTDNLSGSILVRGDAELVLPNGLSMSGSDKITIGLNGSLKMFCGGTECTIGGNGVANLTGYAEDFIVACTPSVKTFTFNGNGEFIGVLVAPEAALTMNGAGSADNNFIGAVMMNSITLNGHFSFHYDEALGRLNNNPRLLITSWDEIP